MAEAAARAVTGHWSTYTPRWWATDKTHTHTLKCTNIHPYFSCSSTRMGEEQWGIFASPPFLWSFHSHWGDVIPHTPHTWEDRRKSNAGLGRHTPWHDRDIVWKKERKCIPGSCVVRSKRKPAALLTLDNFLSALRCSVLKIYIFFFLIWKVIYLGAAAKSKGLVSSPDWILGRVKMPQSLRSTEVL